MSVDRGQQGGAARRRVLVLDDSAAIGKTLARLARALGWSADVAQTWPEAQALLAERRPDVLLADYGLGGDVTGLDAVRTVVAAMPGVRCILMSGGHLGAELCAGLACGFLTKPFTMEVFERALNDGRPPSEAPR